MDRHQPWFHKHITQALCWNVVRWTPAISFHKIYCYSGLPHLFTSNLARKQLRHSPYDLGNVEGWWEHLRKPLPMVSETPACWLRDQEQQWLVWQMSDTVTVSEWLLSGCQDTKGEGGQQEWSIAINCLMQLSRDHYPSPLCQSMLQCKQD